MKDSIVKIMNIDISPRRFAEVFPFPLLLSAATTIFFSSFASTFNYIMLFGCMVELIADIIWMRHWIKRYYKSRRRYGKIKTYKLYFLLYGVLSLFAVVFGAFNVENEFTYLFKVYKLSRYIGWVFGYNIHRGLSALITTAVFALVILLVPAFEEIRKKNEDKLKEANKSQNAEVAEK